MSAMLLLDTHALLWWMNDSAQLSAKAKSAIADTSSTVLVSTATLWEIAIKQRKGRLTGCEEYLERYASWHDKWGFGTLDIRADHALHAGHLPFSHGDPFDRVLIAQSQLLGATLVTRDPDIRNAHPNCLW
jgi:PIN domain nuclease of toxin-antitoxin system